MTSELKECPSDDELLEMCREARLSDKQMSALTYEKGAYDVTIPSHQLRRLYDAFTCHKDEKVQLLIREAIEEAKMHTVSVDASGEVAHKPCECGFCKALKDLEGER